jgi:hypothetical protein
LSKLQLVRDDKLGHARSSHIDHGVEDFIEQVGSNEEVGSSNSMNLGFMQRARAIATPCCCPPEISAGFVAACSGIWTRGVGHTGPVGNAQ